MTQNISQKEKIELMQSTISQLYEKEGRSISYIARLLDVDRSNLSKQIHAWNMEQANVSYLTPSNQKFANKNRQLIISRYDNDVSENRIAAELHVGRDYLRNIVKHVPELREAQARYVKRCEEKAAERKQDALDASRMEYDYEEIPGEIWKDIIGHDGYQVSNMARVRHYAKRYKRHHLVKPARNVKTGRFYVKVGDKNYQLARLVALAFVPGHSKENDTVDHKDTDTDNNVAENLEWVPQSVNNARAYKNGRKANKAYQANGRFKKIVLDGKYEFKTIEALARFLGVSPTQTQRYLSKETPCPHDFKLVY